MDTTEEKEAADEEAEVDSGQSGEEDDEDDFSGGDWFDLGEVGPPPAQEDEDHATVAARELGFMLDQRRISAAAELQLEVDLEIGGSGGGAEPQPQDESILPLDVDPEAPVAHQMNPLLIDAVVDVLFGYLKAPELDACYKVCGLWRRLAVPHLDRTAPIRVPFVVDWTHRHFVAFGRDCSGAPPRWVTNFFFVNADLDSPGVTKLLAAHGQQIRQLTLRYNGDVTSSRSKNLGPGDLQHLLQVGAPNLSTLIISRLPPPIHRELMASWSPLPGLRRIEISFLAMPTSMHVLAALGGPNTALLTSLFTACPNLEELALTQEGAILTGWHGRTSGAQARALVAAFFEARWPGSRPRALQALRIDRFDDEVLRRLHLGLEANQLRSLVLGEYLGADPTVQWAAAAGSAPIAAANPNGPNPFHQLVAQQAGSLECLRATVDVRRPGPSLHQILPPRTPMPNLVELRIALTPSESSRRIRRPAKGLNYAAHFPKLHVLGLSGRRCDFAPQEIFPYPDSTDGLCPPCTSVRILQELPIGVEAVLMTRIGRLFPNLSVLRTCVPYAAEPMLGSIWTGCPNITELSLTLDGDEVRWQSPAAQERVGLDSIFSGIPEPKCKWLQGMDSAEGTPARAQPTAAEATPCRGPSMRDLKGLRRLIIDGPAKSFGGRERDTAAKLTRRDKLTDVFVYSTLAPQPLLNSLSPSESESQLVFCQVETGLIHFSETCLRHACSHLSLELSEGAGRHAMRLIKPGLGYETLKAKLPAEWYGLV